MDMGTRRDLWVVHKGATPAFPDQRGFVGGSMGDDAVIGEGIDNDEATAPRRFAVHAAFERPASLCPNEAA
jgi:tRNA-splicing ligase RtcB